MKWNLYDDEIGQWGKVVVEQRLTTHAEKLASDSELGHVKVDNNTLQVALDGTIKVSDEIALNKFETIVFNVGSTISDGRITETHYPFGFNCRLVKIETSVLQASLSTMNLNFERTTDYMEYEKLLSNDIIIEANSHYKLNEVNGNILINQGDKLFLAFSNTIQDARNAVIVLTVEKI